MTLLETAARTLPDSIAALELDFLGRKLLQDDADEAARRNGERLWDEERVARALHEYRQFLALMLWHPDAYLVPSEDIDEVWHAHVLFTARYQADCDTIFGAFQHHLPELGDAEDAPAEALHGRDDTLQLFEAAFGQIPESYNICDLAKCGRISVDPKCGRATAKCGRAAAKCGRAAFKCGRIAAKCGRASAKCGRMTAKCGRATAKCGRAIAKCGRATAKCGRAAAKCGRATAKCGRNN